MPAAEPAYRTRTATPEDLELICHHREQMFREMGNAEAVLETITANFRDWLRPRLASGGYLGWVTEQGETPVAGAGMMILDWPPHPRHPDDTRRAYILNVFVEPKHRGRGLAKALMVAAQTEAQARGIDFLVLHASAAGRPLYEQLGWQPTTEMSLTLPVK